MIAKTAIQLGLAICLLAASALAKASSLVISGLTDNLAENVRLLVGEVPQDPALEALYIDLLPDQTRQALAALGYYDPTVTVTRETVDDASIILLKVEPNDPVLINSIVVQINGDARLDAQYMPVLGRLPLKRNAIFNSGDYESAKSILIDAAQTRGYFDFLFTENSVRVSRRKQSAEITLVADSGPRYTFGAVTIEQDVFDEAFIERWMPFRTGDPYEAPKLSELTKNLQNSGYFKNVRVAPERDKKHGKTVPVRIAVRRKDRNQVGLGVGFQTDTGPRAKITWGFPILNRYGHSADTELSISEPRQNVSFAYRIPRKNQPLHNYFGIEYGFQNENIDGVKSLLSTLNLQRARRFANDWQESVFIRWEHEISTVSGIERTTDLVLPGVSYARTRSKGAPFPVWGQSSGFQFMYGNRNLLSTIDFYKTVVNFKYLRAVTKRNTFILSLQYGAISTNDFDLVPASQRFFAGGDRSVRGYEYRDLSPRDPAGNPRGGRYLEVTSLEYNYRFTDRWSAAAFVDTGRAFNDFSTRHSVGAGVGVRWQSPVGPFRLDIATPIDDPENDGIRLHLSLGPDL